MAGAWAGLVGCSAFSRVDFPCADGACPGGLVCEANRCVVGVAEGEGEGEGEGEVAQLIPFGDATPDTILEVEGGLLVAWSQLQNEATVLLEAPGEGLQRVGLARFPFGGGAELLADSGPLSGIFIPDAARTSTGLVLGLQTGAPFSWAGCDSAGTAESIVVATLSSGGVCTTALAAFPSPDLGANVQYVASGADAVAFVVGASPGLTVVDHPEAPVSERAVGVLRGGTLTFTDLTGFAGDLAFTDRAIVVGSRDDRPWVQTDDGQEEVIQGAGSFEWTAVEALPDGDLIVAGSGSGVVDDEPCVADDGALHTAVARLAGETLRPRWLRGLCVDSSASVGIDLIVPEPGRGLVHVFGFTEGPLAFADADVSVAPRDGDPATGYLLALDLDDGVPQAGRPAPFGRFFTASLLDDGRMAVGLVAAARSDFDGVEVANGAIVITRP